MERTTSPTPNWVQDRLFEVDSDTVIADLCCRAAGVSVVPIDMYDGSHEIEHGLGEYKRQEQHANTHPLYIEARYLLYSRLRDYYLDANDVRGLNVRYSAYAAAKQLAETNIHDPTQYMREIGEPAFKSAIEYWNKVKESDDGGDNRLKGLRYGAFQIAKDFADYGIDPTHEKLKEVTELIFELVPIIGGFRFEFGREQVAELITIERLFGSVVSDKYLEIFNQKWSEGQFAPAFEILDILTTLGLVTKELQEQFLISMLESGWSETEYFAEEWFWRYDLSLAKEIAEVVRAFGPKSIEYDEEPF